MLRAFLRASSSNSPSLQRFRTMEWGRQVGCSLAGRLLQPPCSALFRLGRSADPHPLVSAPTRSGGPRHVGFFPQIAQRLGRGAAGET